MLIDKDIKNTLFYLDSQVDKWYLASSGETRGANFYQLAKYINSPYKFNTVRDAWFQVMKEAKKQDIVLVCGSFHAVAEVMKLEII